LSLIKKNDDWSSVIAEVALKAFTSTDDYLTMRFSQLLPEEQFPATMAWGNSRLFLNTGVSQCKRQAEALQKYKDANYKAEGMSENDKKLLPKIDASFDPREVDEFLLDWKEYDQSQPPNSEHNVVVIINRLRRWNQSLMWWCDAWDAIQKALYNLRYAWNSRTFKGFLELGRNMYEREHEISIGEHKRRLPNPFGKKKDEE
jgi:hypothetical protein